MCFLKRNITNRGSIFCHVSTPIRDSNDFAFFSNKNKTVGQRFLVQSMLGKTTSTLRNINNLYPTVKI